MPVKERSDLRKPEWYVCFTTKTYVFGDACDRALRAHEQGSMSPQQYIERKRYERMFASKPRTNVTSPLEKNDHPETDNSDFLHEGRHTTVSVIGRIALIGRESGKI